jgi:hypothetical protein
MTARTAPNTCREFIAPPPPGRWPPPRCAASAHGIDPTRQCKFGQVAAVTVALTRKVRAVVVAIATTSVASCGDDGSWDAAVPNGNGSSSSIVNEHDGSHHVVADSGAANPDQIARIRAAMAKYEDIEVALADGWLQEHPDWPETGAHFYRESDWAGPGPVRPEVNPVDPEFLMYSKLRTGEWELVAVAYVVDQALYPEPPTALQGPSTTSTCGPASSTAKSSRRTTMARSLTRSAGRWTVNCHRAGCG